jgi:hypothetical protein
LGAAKLEFEAFAFTCAPKGYFVSHRPLYAGLIELNVNGHASMTYSGMSKGSAILGVKSQLSLPGQDPGKDVRMPNTAAVVQLPEILRNRTSHLVKLAGKVDSFSLLLRETPEGELKRSIEEQFHTTVFATRKEIRKYCPRYRYLPGEGILDFGTDCASGQLEPGDLGKAPPPKRGRLCEKCCFFAGIPEEQLSVTTVSPAPQDLVLVV